MREFLDLVESTDVGHNFIQAAERALDEAGVPNFVRVDLGIDEVGAFFSDNAIVVLDYIEVPEEEQGNGYGSMVMEVLTKLADKMHIALALIASDDDNAYWFEQFGFSGNRKMIREPSLAEQVISEINKMDQYEYGDSEIRTRLRQIHYLPGWQKMGKRGDVFVQQVSYNEGHNMEVRLVKDKQAIGFASLVKATYSGVTGYIMLEIGVLFDHQALGYGKLIYTFLLDQGHVLFSGGSQTPDGRRMWQWLMNQPGIHTYETMLPDEDDDVHPFTPIENGKPQGDSWGVADARLVATKKPLA